MLGKPKQKRSQDRINKILQTAESILEHESTDALTIAKISEMAGLKRTSTSVSYTHLTLPTTPYV